MCAVLLPPGGYQIRVDKYTIIIMSAFVSNYGYIWILLLLLL